MTLYLSPAAGQRIHKCILQWSKVRYSAYTSYDRSYPRNTTRFVRMQNFSSSFCSNQTISSSDDFQSILSSRRTAQKFLPLSAYPNTRDPNGDWITQATTRAIQCAVTAPCHHRTEPTTFLRIHSTSNTATTLTDILYQVTFRKQLKILQHTSSSSTSIEDGEDVMGMDMMIEEAQNRAAKKQQKWKDTVCTYIVVLVQGQPLQEDVERGQKHVDKQEIGTTYMYDLLPYRPPQTERQLEDVSFIFFCFEIGCINYLTTLNTFEYPSIIVCFSMCIDTKFTLITPFRRFGM